MESERIKVRTGWSEKRKNKGKNRMERKVKE